MPGTAKQTVRRVKAAQVTAASIKRRGPNSTATKGGSANRVTKSGRGGVQAARRAKSASRSAAGAAKAADVAARRRIAATLDLSAFTAALPSAARATAKHWATPD